MILSGVTVSSVIGFLMAIGVLFAIVGIPLLLLLTPFLMLIVCIRAAKRNRIRRQLEEEMLTSLQCQRRNYRRV